MVLLTIRKVFVDRLADVPCTGGEPISQREKGCRRKTSCFLDLNGIRKACAAASVLKDLKAKSKNEEEPRGRRQRPFPWRVLVYSYLK